MSQDQTADALRLIHGNDLCHICGRPQAGEGSSICSYPHARVPVKAVDAEQPEGFWSWEAISNGAE